MININYTLERTKGKHLTLEERIKIEKALCDRNKSKRQIARELGVNHQTVINEIKRGTVTQVKKINGKLKYFENYSALAAQEAYYKGRNKNKNASKLEKCKEFINTVVEKIKNEKSSIDEIVGRVKLEQTCSKSKIVCTKTIYNYVEKGLIAIKNIDLPLRVRRKANNRKSVKNKRILGKSIQERPVSIETREEFGHFEADTVIGKKGEQATILVLTERKTRYQINVLIDDKTADAVEYGFAKVIKDIGNNIIKTVTVDNGSEFSTLSKFLKPICEVYYARPYRASDRGTNENQNRIIRMFLPKYTSLEHLTRKELAKITEYMNNKPRKIHGYKTAKELFLEELDRIKN